MKMNDFDRVDGRLDTAVERISELEDIGQQKCPKPKCKEKENLKNPEQDIQELWDY